MKSGMDFSLQKNQKSKPQQLRGETHQGRLSGGVSFLKEKQEFVGLSVVTTTLYLHILTEVHLIFPLQTLWIENRDGKEPFAGKVARDC